MIEAYYAGRGSRSSAGISGRDGKLGGKFAERFVLLCICLSPDCLVDHRKNISQKYTVPILPPRVLSD